MSNFMGVGIFWIGLNRADLDCWRLIVNDSDMFNFQNLILFLVATSKLRFLYIDIPLSFIISRDIKS